MDSYRVLVNLEQDIVCNFSVSWQTKWSLKRRNSKLLCAQTVKVLSEAPAAVGPEPDPELNPNEAVDLRDILADYGIMVARSLGPLGPEILHMRETSRGMRLRTAMLWADLHPRVPPTPRSEAHRQWFHPIVCFLSAQPCS